MRRAMMRPPGPGRRVVLLCVLATVAGAMGSVMTSAQVGSALDDAEQACTDPSESFTLFAERLGGRGRNRRIGYGLTPGRATIPGPTLEVTEGTCFVVTLTNDTGRRLGLHAHGVSYSTASDGTPLNGNCVRPGRSRSYLFDANAPITRADGTIDPGTAGYWHYHDHCRGSRHGTGGLDAGLFGALIVRKASDPVPARKPYVVFMKDISINLKRGASTPVFKANLGERVEFVVITHGDLFHTFHLHGHRWVDNRTGMPSSPAETTTIIDNKTQGPGDSFGFQIVAGEHVGTGAWMYHCHVQGHSDAGMGGIFLVRTAGGQVTAKAREGLEAWRAQHAQHGGHG